MNEEPKLWTVGMISNDTLINANLKMSGRIEPMQHAVTGIPFDARLITYEQKGLGLPEMQKPLNVFIEGVQNICKAIYTNFIKPLMAALSKVARQILAIFRRSGIVSTSKPHAQRRKVSSRRLHVYQMKHTEEGKR